VTFSGDKLLGGPQAGIIAGRADLVARCARHPLARALRPGGLVLSALQQTMLAYLRRDGQAISFWRMATVPEAELEGRAGAVVAALAAVGARASVVRCLAVAGGGSVPGLGIPSIGVAVEGDRRAALRRHEPPVIARIEDGRTLCDLRSVDPAMDPALVDALAGVLAARSVAAPAAGDPGPLQHPEGGVSAERGR
jgi:L-seryl-tRNA(Ser) seleniumtransferase